MVRGVVRWAIGLGGIALGVAAACDSEGEFVAEVEDDIGRICAYHDDCASVCEAGLDGMAPYCTRRCDFEPCPAGYYCVARGTLGRVCAMGECASDADCPADYVCHPEEEVCRHADIPCGSDADCPAATACNQGACTTVCHGDEDCKQGFVCNWFLDRCMPCSVHSDCDGGFACMGGVCGAECLIDGECRPGFDCYRGACTPIVGGGPGELGASCEDHRDCVEFCHHDRCAETCEVPNGAGECPDGFYCEQNAMACLPSA